jgi:hypothetical protein
MAKRLLAAAVVLLALTSIVIGIVLARRHEEKPAEPVHVGPLEDPRLAYAGPYRTIHPDVRYVGDAACIKCHKDETATYKRHPMGRSMVAITEHADVVPLDRQHNNPFVHDGMTFEVVKEGARVWHRRRRFDEEGKLIYEFKQEVHYAIGSGARGYSYLSRTEDGFLFQTPISWYSQTKEWKLSPGFEFSGLNPRIIHAQCVFCHANRAHFREDSLNHYDEPILEGLAIGCERCHGPGELHVQSKQRLDIINPKRLKPALREAVCQQCHLEGQARILHRGRKLEEFRPGLAIEDFWSVFVEMEENGAPKAVSQVEQMYQSGCFTGGTDDHRLGCSTCHNPHDAVEPQEATSYYNARCLECHQQRGCTEPKAERLKKQKDDSCIACHMPRRGSKDIPHTAFTDHRIPRKPGQPANARGIRTLTHLGSTRLGSFLRSFNPGEHEFAAGESSRDLGIAFNYLAETGKVRAEMLLNGPAALSLVDGALKRVPGDTEAQAARASFRLSLRNDPEGALADIEAVLEKRPDWELGLGKAGWLAAKLGRQDRATAYYRRCVAANPWMPGYRQFLAEILIQQGDWAAAWPHIQMWQQLDPESIDARSQAVDCLLHLGKKSEARAEFNKIVLLRPANLAKLQDRFSDKIR